MDFTPTPLEPGDPVAPLPPVIQTALVYSEDPSVRTVLVRDQIYFPSSQAGAVVCHPLVGAVVFEELFAYSTSTDLTPTPSFPSFPS